jgi:hypothetical protein
MPSKPPPEGSSDPVLAVASKPAEGTASVASLGRKRRTPPRACCVPDREAIGGISSPVGPCDSRQGETNGNHQGRPRTADLPGSLIAEMAARHRAEPCDLCTTSRSPAAEQDAR